MKKIVFILILSITMLLTSACSANKLNDPLDPDKPITVTVWHYYNGLPKEYFDELVLEFNDTIGIEKGIVIDSKSQGDVEQLANDVFDSAKGAIGAPPIPDIFATYADNAYRVSKVADLVSLDQYFEEDELQSYRQEFLETGKFVEDNKYYIVPIAKSFENLYVNNTHWQPFARRHGFTNSDLETWEGIYDVAEAYYNETSNSFFGLDSIANYMLVANIQLGSELYTYLDDGTVIFDFKKENAKIIWDYFYRPFIKGYFLKEGRFSSDDAKTGSILSYVGSTAGAAYFPSMITCDDNEMEEIEPLVLPYPHFINGSKVAIQQGAGMAVSKSDEAHEYASMLFLKWLTEPAQNLRFTVPAGYFPVKNQAFDEMTMLDITKNGQAPAKSISETIKASNIMFNRYEFYNSKPFIGTFEMRILLNTHLINKINKDLEILNDRVSNGENRQDLISDLCSDQSFEEWYSEFIDEGETILNRD